MLIHCGDFTKGAVRGQTVISNDHYLSFCAFVESLVRIRHRWEHVICVPGNHDKICEHQPFLAKEILYDRARAHLLIDEYIILDGIKYYGMPWTPAFNNWFFQGTKRNLPLACSAIDDDTEVLITHGPQWGVFDQVAAGAEHLGCVALADRLGDLIRLKLHAFGHVHGAGGQKRIRDRPCYPYWTANAAVLNEQYLCEHEPMEVTLD